MSKQSLKEITVSGVGWSAIDNISQYAVSFVVSIILARLLSPEDYGLIGIIAIFIAVCNALINGGFTDALIRKNDLTEDDYNTAYVVNLLVSLLLYFILFICAKPISVFFNRTELVPLVRVSTISMILGALAMVQQTRLTKRIDFKSQTKITLVASIISGGIGIAMAFMGCGVWSLVTQGLSRQFIVTLLLWFNNHWVPRLRFSYVSFKYLFGFGWKISVSHILNTVWEELNKAVIGKFYYPATLGQYTRATQFSSLFSSNLTNVIQRVSFPVLSDIQDDKLRMISAYKRILKTSMLAAAIGSFFLASISEPLLFCLIGPKWHDAAVYLPLICVSASLYPLHAINLNMLKIQGRSDLFLILEIIKKIVALVPLFVGAFIGVIPMLYVTIATSIIAYFLNSFYSGRLFGYSSWMQIKDIAPDFGVALLVALSVWFLRYLPISNWIILPIQLLVGLCVAVSLCHLFNLSEYKEIRTMLFSFVKVKS